MRKSQIPSDGIAHFEQGQCTRTELSVSIKNIADNDYPTERNYHQLQVEAVYERTEIKDCIADKFEPFIARCLMSLDGGVRLNANVT